MKRTRLSQYLFLVFGFFAYESMLMAETWIVARGGDAQQIFTAMHVESTSKEIELGQSQEGYPKYMGYSCILTQSTKTQGPLSCTFKPTYETLEANASASGYTCTVTQEFEGESAIRRLPNHFEISGEKAKQIYDIIESDVATTSLTRHKKAGNMTCGYSSRETTPDTPAALDLPYLCIFSSLPQPEDE